MEVIGRSGVLRDRFHATAIKNKKNRASYYVVHQKKRKRETFTAK